MSNPLKLREEPFNMWLHWREKYGPRTAVEEYFCCSLATNIDLQLAISQIKNAERAIDAIMEELANE